MAIEGIVQPEILKINDTLRLRKFDGIYDFAFDWYQDEETVYLVDGVRKKYSSETLKCMYEYLDKQGELYFIELLENDKFKPIGALIERGLSLGYTELYVGEIYEFNIVSRKCFESLGFVAYEKTEKGNRLKKCLEI